MKMANIMHTTFLYVVLTEVFFQKSNLQLISIASGNEQATTDYLNQIPPNSLNACVRVRQRAYVPVSKMSVVWKATD